MKAAFVILLHHALVVLGLSRYGLSKCWYRDLSSSRASSFLLFHFIHRTALIPNDPSTDFPVSHALILQPAFRVYMTLCQIITTSLSSLKVSSGIEKEIHEFLSLRPRIGFPRHTKTNRQLNHSTALTLEPSLQVTQYLWDKLENSTLHSREPDLHFRTGLAIS